MNDKIYQVYIIRCKVDNKFYIGQTYLPLNERFSKHKTAAKSGKDTKFYRHMRKYGIENHYIENLDYCNNQNELDDLEYQYILENKNNPNFLNTKFTKGKCGGDTFKYINAFPDDIKEEIHKKISEKVSGGKNHNAKVVFAFNPIKNIYKEYDCAEYAAKDFSVSHNSICRRCNHEITTLLNGWTFAYEKNGFTYRFDIYTRSCKRIKVINLLNKATAIYNSYRDAEKNLNFPKGTIAKVLNRNRYI